MHSFICHVLLLLSPVFLMVSAGGVGDGATCPGLARHLLSAPQLLVLYSIILSFGWSPSFLLSTDCQVIYRLSSHPQTVKSSTDCQSSSDCQVIHRLSSHLQTVKLSTDCQICCCSLSLSPFLPFSLSPFLPFSLSPFLPFSLSPFLPFSLSPFLPFSLSPFLPFSLSPFLPSLDVAIPGNRASLNISSMPSIPPVASTSCLFSEPSARGLSPFSSSSSQFTRGGAHLFSSAPVPHLAVFICSSHVLFLLIIIHCQVLI